MNPAVSSSVCQKCGFAANRIGARWCSKCGSKLISLEDLQVSSPQAPRKLEEEVVQQTPKAIALAEIVTGISGVFLGTLLVAAFQNADPISVFPALSDLSPRAATIFLDIVGATLGVIGTLDIIAGLWSFQGTRWAWILGLGVNSALGVLSFMWLFAVSTLTGLPGVLAGFLITYYLKRPEVSDSFGSSLRGHR